MPEIKELDILNITDIKFESDCEKVKFLADEYLHGELSEENSGFIQSHIKECKNCFDFIEEEKLYLEEIKLAEYIPEISVSQAVMNKIIENKIIIDKPPRKRFVPVGFISAAAVVILMFIVSKGGLLDIFVKSSKDASFNESSNHAEMMQDADANANENEYGYGDFFSNDSDDSGDSGNTEYDGRYDFALGTASSDGEISEEPEEEEDFMAIEVEESAVDAADDESLALVNSPAPAPESSNVEAARLPTAVDESEFESMDEYISLNSGMAIDEIYEIYFINTGIDGKAETRQNILNYNSEIYRTDDTHEMFDIIELKYKDILDKSLIDNNISVMEILNKNQSGGYIAVVYWFN